MSDNSEREMSTYMTQDVSQSLGVTIHADVFDSHVSVEEDQVHTGLSGLASQQVCDVLDQFSDIEIFRLSRPAQQALLVRPTQCVAQPLHVGREIIETPHRREQSGERRRRHLDRASGILFLGIIKEMRRGQVEESLNGGLK
jgi:hypothetical protein